MGEDVARDPECIFCKILEGDIPAYKLFEDEHTFAFMDINPLNDGHALIIPKDHHPNIFDTPTNVLAPLMETTQRIARAIQNSIAPEYITSQRPRCCPIRFPCPLPCPATQERR